MKKALSIALSLVLLLGTMVVPCSYASSVSLDVTLDDDSVGVYDTTIARCSIGDYSENYSIETISWSSDNSNVASVSSSGHDYYGATATVTGRTAGTTTIRCSGTLEPDMEEESYWSSDGESYSNSYSTLYFSGYARITVEGSTGLYSLTDVTITGSSSMYVGESATFNAYTSGVDEDYVSFSWSSSNTSVATVSGGSRSYATVYAKKSGTAYITVNAKYGTAQASESLKVTVYGGSTVTTPEIYSDLPSSQTVTYGSNSYLEVSARADYGTVYYEWYVDGKYNSSSTSRSFNTRNLSVGKHTVYCEVYAKYNGYTSGRDESRTCTVYVENGSTYTPTISSDLTSSKTVTYGQSNTISLTAKASYGTIYYEWYVDGKLNTTSTTNSFNTRYLSVGSHSVYCNVYTKYNGNTSGRVSSRTCAVTVKSNGSSSGGTTTGQMSNFRQVQTYYSNFSDVPAGQWYYDAVKNAYQYGLVNGKGNGLYGAADYFTIAEALKLAAVIHSTYYNGGSTIAAVSGSGWYTPYVNYCINNGIINSGDFTNYTQNCTKAQMAYIFSRCLPAEEISAIRSVSVPDCNSYTPYYSNILTLYNAGVVTGDSNHYFYPNNLIRRREVATIVNNLVNPSVRDSATY